MIPVHGRNVPIPRFSLLTLLSNIARRVQFPPKMVLAGTTGAVRLAVVFVDAKCPKFASLLLSSETVNA